MISIFNKRQLIILGMMLAAILVRLLPHPPNVTPVTAIALFGGAFFNDKRLGLILPLVVMFISDIFIGFSTISLFVYAALLCISILGQYFKKVNFGSILASSIIFFIVSNFGVWIIGYPKTWHGLLECYTLAIPFFRNAIIGDFLFSFIMAYSFLRVEKHYLKTI